MKDFHLTREGTVISSAEDRFGFNRLVSVRKDLKAQATEEFLRRLALSVSNPPQTIFRGDAYCTFWHNGELWAFETGTKTKTCMCLGTHETKAQCLNDPTFLYYASEAYTSEASK